jgi:hypothetical protein
VDKKLFPTRISGVDQISNAQCADKRGDLDQIYGGDHGRCYRPSRSICKHTRFGTRRTIE